MVKRIWVEMEILLPLKSSIKSEDEIRLTKSIFISQGIHIKMMIRFSMNPREFIFMFSNAHVVP